MDSKSALLLVFVFTVHHPQNQADGRVRKQLGAPPVEDISNFGVSTVQLIMSILLVRSRIGTGKLTPVPRSGGFSSFHSYDVDMAWGSDFAIIQVAH